MYVMSKRSQRAWRVVQRTVHRLGQYASVDFEDPRINAAIWRLGGWIRLCEYPEATCELQFRRSYDDVLRTTVEPNETRYLPGMHERMNRAFPCGADGPRRIEVPGYAGSEHERGVSGKLHDIPPSGGGQGKEGGGGSSSNRS
jgi:hypothetical protein